MTIILVPGDRHSEVPPTLLDPTPQPLGLADQVGLWGNLGVSLLGFTGAVFVLQPNGAGTPSLSIAAALVAVVLGTLLGTAAVAAAAVPGAVTGAPAMVLLRGLLGARLSYLPTALNVAQCLGWGTFELVTIAAAGHRIAPGAPSWALTVTAGTVTTLLALRPLGWVRSLRRYVTVAVALTLVYLCVQLLRHPVVAPQPAGWGGFWVAVDTLVGVAVSFAPLAADYTRHSRSPRSAFSGAMAGYAPTQVACYVLGILALLTTARSSGDVFGAFTAVPLGTLAFGVLAVRELDQSFTNVYSTAVSLQNLRPSLDRRILAVALGVLTTAASLVVHISDYESFLTLIGSVFVPLAAVLTVDWYLVSGSRWDLGDSSRARPSRLVPWVAGFLAYQLVNPGQVSWWAAAWQSVDSAIGFTPPSWLSATLLSLVVAAVGMLAIGLVERRRAG